MSEKETKQYPDHWLEGISWQILDRKTKVINLSTGKTPSGHVHLGILRELLICEGLRRIFTAKKIPVKYRMFLDSLDAAKRFPEYVPKEYAQNNLGRPFALIPNPFEKDGRHFAQVFGDELSNTFPELGITVDIVWTHELYKTKAMQDMIRIGLKKNDQIKDIIANFLTSTMTDEEKDDFAVQQENWMGAMVICEKCQSTQKRFKDEQVDEIHANRVLTYDEKTDEVTYKCPNCEYEGKVKVSSGLVKLNWRLDWPAKWTIFQTTCEPAGKDHCTPGGSYDTGLELSRKIFGYEGPVKVPYEWLRLGDADMKTSKGIVFTPKHYLEMADPELIRMQIYMTNPNKHISFRVEEIPQYYNEYERIEKIYFGLEKAVSAEEEREIKYAFPIIQVKEVPDKFYAKMPFKLLVILAQLKPLLGEEGIYQKTKDYMIREKFEKVLSKEEILKKVNRVFNWVQELAQMIAKEKDPEILKKLKTKVEFFSFPETVSAEIKQSLDESQKASFTLFLEKIKEIDAFTDDNVKDIVMGIQQKLNIKPPKLFSAFYSVLIGAKGGPRLGPLLSMMDKKWIVDRIKQALE